MQHAQTMPSKFDLSSSHSSAAGTDSAHPSARGHTFDFRRLADRRKAVTHSLPASARGYGNFEGRPAGMLNTSPSPNPSAYTRTESNVTLQPAAGAAQAAPAIGLNLSLLLAVLDQVDYGLAVINTETHQLVHANLHAQNALHPSNGHATGLCVNNGLLTTLHADQAEHLTLALNRTKSRVRSLLRLTESAGPPPAKTLASALTARAKASKPSVDGIAKAKDDACNTPFEGMSIAVVPLSGTLCSAEDAFSNVAHSPLSSSSSASGTATSANSATTAACASTSPNYALLVFAKQQLCDTTTVTLFARERGLTGAEGLVLEQVCKGLRPSQIATRHGVQISTVRTQLRAIRQKTASVSVRELVEKVSVLPPLARNLPNLWGSHPAFSLN